MCGCYYSAGTISNITNQITSQVESHHQRKLNDKFFDYRIAPVENLTVWEEMIADFKDHGVNQVELFLSDGFVGIKNMLKQYYPNSKFQRCLVHVMRNISQKARSAILSEFKQVQSSSCRRGPTRLLRQVQSPIP